MNKKQLIQELHRRLDGPFKEFITAAKRYDEQPSIPNGARKQEAREALEAIKERLIEELAQRWADLDITKYKDMIKEEERKLREAHEQAK